MRRQDFTLEDIQFNRRISKHKPLKLPDDCIWIEDVCWYDWICKYQDKEWNHYSLVAHVPLEDDEMCKYWYIYKVEYVKDGEGTFNYHYKVISKRVDTNGYVPADNI